MSRGLAYTYDGPWIEEVAVGGPFEASIQLEADRPQAGLAATNFWLGTLRINDDPSTELVYEYDDDGLVTRIEDMDLFYEAASGRWLGSHVEETGTRITRNGFGELERLEAGYFGPPFVVSGPPPYAGEALLDVTYERDKLGRIVRKTEKTRACVDGTPACVDGTQGTRIYEYTYDDDRGWLTQVKLDGALLESYGYDDNGNRTSWLTGFGMGSATYDDQDRLKTYGAKSFTYTENGELLTKSEGGFTTTYTYDVFGNLRAVRLPDGLQIEYLVDASNRRIAKKVDGTIVKRYLYPGGLSPIAELDGAGGVETQYVYGTGGNVPDYFVRGGVTYRIFTDHLGSVRFVVDASTGEVVQRMEYDSFGRITLDTNSGFQPFGFAGGLYDYQTGLVRFGARDYDPETGRWTSKDPIGFAGGDTSLYGYVVGDPVDGVDPSGYVLQSASEEEVAAFREALIAGGAHDLAQSLTFSTTGDVIQVDSVDPALENSGNQIVGLVARLINETSKIGYLTFTEDPLEGIGGAITEGVTGISSTRYTIEMNRETISNLIVPGMLFDPGVVMRPTYFSITVSEALIHELGHLEVGFSTGLLGVPESWFRAVEVENILRANEDSALRRTSHAGGILVRRRH